MILDLILLLVFFAMVFFAWRRGFFVTVLRLGAWIVSIAAAGALSSALAAPVYEAFIAGPARRMIETQIDHTISSSDTAQYVQGVIAELPDALSQLAARVGGISLDSLIANLDTQRFTAANAAQLLEQSIVAPIGTAVARFALAIVVFLLLMLVTRFLLRRLEKIRKLPVLKQADRIMGAALGVIKGALLLLVLTLALRAAAALAEGSNFAELVDTSRIVTLFNWSKV